MFEPIKSAMKRAGYDSYDLLAKALVENFPDIEWGGYRSVSGQIGKLDRGVSQWWVKRTDKLDCLKSFLDITESDLGIHCKSERQYFTLEDFPEMPPLDLRRHEIWDLGEWQCLNNGSGHKPSLDEWFNRSHYSWHQPQSIDWLCMKDDVFRAVLGRRLEVHSDFDVSYLVSLEQADGQLFDPKPQVLIIEQSCGAMDIQILAKRSEGCGLLVIAPFELQSDSHERTEMPFTYEYVTAQVDNRRAMELLSGQGYAEPIYRWVWEYGVDWRERLLDWMEGYLNKNKVDTLFSSKELKNWLFDFDSNSKWFNTFGGMLKLCRAGHWGSKRLPKVIDKLAGHKLMELFYAKEQKIMQLNLDKLAKKRWDSVDLVWNDPLPLERWQSMASEIKPSLSTADIDKIASSKELSEIQDIVDALVQNKDFWDVAELISESLLREVGVGKFDFHQPDVAGLLVRDYLMSILTTLPLASWSNVCFDPSRRPMLDAVLNSLNLDELLEITKKIIKEPSDSAECIGCSEALFLEIGKRIIRKEKIPETFYCVAEFVHGRLNFDLIFSMPLPWSRQVQTDEEKLEWVSICWAWSLEHNKLGNSSEWLFPGDARELSDLPDWIKTFKPSKDLMQLSSGWTLLMQVAGQWLDDLEQPLSEMPEFISPLLILKGALGRWDIREEWWAEVVNIRWADNILLEGINGMTQECLVRLWVSLIGFQERNQNEDFHSERRFLYSSLRKALLENLVPETALSSLDKSGLNYLTARPHYLPSKFREPLFKLVKLDIVKDHINRLEIFKRYGQEISDHLAEFLNHNDAYIDAIDCLWEWQPRRLINAVKQNQSLNIDARDSILLRVPEEFKDEMSDLLLANPSLFSKDVKHEWLMDYLPYSGNRAKKILQLLSK